MAPTPPLEQDHQEPHHGRSAMPASTAIARVGFGLSLRAGGDRHPGAGGAPSIALTSASVRIEDGLLMAFGPEGDPIPPATFVSLAAEQPDAEVNLTDGGSVPALQVAQVLEAQAKGPLGAGAGDPIAAAAWIEAMLGLGPTPAHAAEAELRGEHRGCELTAFGRELMLTMPDGRSFVIADLAPAQSATAMAGLVLADGRCLAIGELVARLRADAEQRPRADAGNTGAAVQPFAEVVLPGCAVQRSGDALLLELPGVGTLRLATLASDAAPGPRVAIALADGQAAGVAEVIAALAPAAGADERAAREDRLALPAPASLPTCASLSAPASLPAPDSDAALPGPAAPVRRVPVTIGAPRVEGIDPDRIVVVIIGGVPAGGVLSAGIEDGAGRWLVSPRHLAGLTLTLPADRSGDPTLEVTAVAVRNRAGEFATATESVVLSLAAPAEACLPLALGRAVLQPGGPTLNAVMIRGVPPGARLSAGTYDGATHAWVLRPDQIEGLSLSAPVGQAAATLTVMGISLAAGGRAEARVLTRLTLPRP